MNYRNAISFSRGQVDWFHVNARGEWSEEILAYVNAIGDLISIKSAFIMGPERGPKLKILIVNEEEHMIIFSDKPIDNWHMLAHIAEIEGWYFIENADEIELWDDYNIELFGKPAEKLDWKSIMFIG